MFEDVKKEDQHIMTGDPKTVQDIFNDVDPAAEALSAVKSGRLKPTGQGTAAPSAGAQGATEVHIGPPDPLTRLSQIEHTGGQRQYRGIRIAVIILVLVAAGGVAAYLMFGRPAPAPTDDTNANTNTSPTTADNTNTPPDNTNDQDVSPVPTNSLIDTDGDGLSNVEEQALGTDPLSIDTDGDGLNDRDEIHVHKTNPLLSDTDNDGLSDRDEVFSWLTDPHNPDTDGDTHLDGTEVQNGYNPNGAGKLQPTL
ncbi:MAG: hypothetical protein AAB490_02355 [Patescibacteria group bacterium]